MDGREHRLATAVHAKTLIADEVTLLAHAPQQPNRVNIGTLFKLERRKEEKEEEGPPSCDSQGARVGNASRRALSRPVIARAVTPSTHATDIGRRRAGHLYFSHLSSCLRNHNDMSEQEPLLPSTSADRGDAATQTAWKEWTAELLESPRLHKTVIALARTSPINRVIHCPTSRLLCMNRS